MKEYREPVRSGSGIKTIIHHRTLFYCDVSPVYNVYEPTVERRRDRKAGG